MGAPHISQFGKFCVVQACGLSTATAAGTGDNSAVTGATIDRLEFGSCKLVIAYKTTLGSLETLKYAVAMEDSVNSNMSSSTTTTLQATTTAATGVLTGNVNEITFDVDLSGKGRYIRFNFTPDLSASGTDTAISCAVCVLGGALTLPPTQP